MLFIDRHGEGIYVSGRKRLRDPSVLRVRAMQMYRMRCEGIPVASIALYFKVSPRLVYRELDKIPDAQKGRIDGFMG